MRRREFITLLGTAAAWPFVANAQAPPIPVIGYLSARSPEDTANLLAAFRSGLAQSGFLEGQNVAIEYRWDAVNTIDCRRWRQSLLAARYRS